MLHQGFRRPARPEPEHRTSSSLQAKDRVRRFRAAVRLMLWQGFRRPELLRAKTLMRILQDSAFNATVK